MTALEQFVLHARWFAILLVATVGLAQPTFQKRWHWFPEGAGRSIAQTSDGGYVLGAGVRLDTTRHGMLTARTEESGDTLWVRYVYDIDAGSGYSCLAGDGGSVIVGTKDGLHILAYKYDTLGDSVWSYASAWRGRVSAVISTDDSGCLAVGRIPDSMYDFGAIKLDARGHEEWAHYFEALGLYATWARGADQTADTGYIICGDGYDYDVSYARLIRTYRDGGLVWSRLYRGQSGVSLRSVRQTQDGGFLAVGTEFDTLARQNTAYVLRTDPSGSALWSRHIVPPTPNCEARALCETHDGYIIAATADWYDSARIWLLKIDSTGDTLWTSLLGGPGREIPSDVKQTSDGGYVITGASDWYGGSVLFFKTDSLGRLMTAVHDGRWLMPGASRSLSIAPSPARTAARVAYAPIGNLTGTLNLYDAAGRLARTFAAPRNGVCWLDLAGLPRGCYLLRLTTSGCSAASKLVIE